MLRLLPKYQTRHFWFARRTLYLNMFRVANSVQRCCSEHSETKHFSKHGTCHWSRRNLRKLCYMSGVPHSGYFLNAVPCSVVDTRLDDTLLCLAVTLRIGAQNCAPHVSLWSTDLQWWNTGPTCGKSAGRHMRHKAINDLIIIKRALVSANVKCCLATVESNFSGVCWHR